MELRQLKTMIAISDHRTFAEAAAAVGLSQSAISQQVRALEEELGVSLFDRATRPPVLNVHGQILVEGARQVAETCGQIVGAVSGSKLNGVLFLGATRSCEIGLLPRVLVSLRKKYPELRIRVSSGSSDDQLFSVVSGRTDAAIIAGPIDIAEGANWYPFFNESMVVIAPAGTPGRSDREVLESLPFIRFRRNVPTATLISSEIARRRINVRVEMEIDSLQAIVIMVSHGLGVSVVPERVVEEPFPVEVRTLPFGDPPLKRETGVVERTSNPKSHLVQALYEELLSQSATIGPRSR